jgi:hypothetical protein
MAPRLRSFLVPILVPALILCATGIISAQSVTSSQYTQCVAPAVQQQESNLLTIQQIFEQQHVALVAQRGQARIQAWTIPEESARRDAIRDADKAYRSALRDLKKWFRDQEKQIKRTFRDQEDICDDQFDDDVDDDEFFSSSSSSSQFSFVFSVPASSSSSFPFSFPSSYSSSQFSYYYSYPGSSSKSYTIYIPNYSSMSYYYYSYPGYQSAPSAFYPTLRPVEPGEIEWMY